MQQLIQDLKFGLRATRAPFAAIIVLLFLMTVINLYQAGHIEGIQGTYRLGVDDVPIGPIVTSMLAGIALVLGSIVCWCWFIANWIQEEFGIRTPVGKSRFFKHVIWRQFLACLLASFASAILGLPIMFIVAWTVMPTVMDFITTYSLTYTTGSALLFMISLVSGIPILLTMSYLYLRYSAGLVVGAKTGQLMGSAAAFSYTPGNSPKNHVYRCAWKMTLFFLAMSTISNVSSYFLLMALSDGAITSSLPDGANMLLAIPSFVWLAVTLIGAGLILIRFLRHVQVPDTAT